MKLYKTTYRVLITDGFAAEGEYQTKACWHPSADAASKNRTALKAADRNSKPETTPVDVPTTKAELVAWLNTNAD